MHCKFESIRKRKKKKKPTEVSKTWAAVRRLVEYEKISTKKASSKATGGAGNEAMRLAVLQIAWHRRVEVLLHSARERRVS